MKNTKLKDFIIYFFEILFMIIIFGAGLFMLYLIAKYFIHNIS